MWLPTRFPPNRTLRQRTERCDGRLQCRGRSAPAALSRRGFLLLLVLLLVEVVTEVRLAGEADAAGFLYPSPLPLSKCRGAKTILCTRKWTFLYEENSKTNRDPDDEEHRTYRFGDITRSLAKRAAERVNGLTGKDSYQFGDLSNYLDAKNRVQSIKGGSTQDSYQYEFGDLSRWADALAKEKAAQFAGKQSSDEYRFGDISRTVITKVRSGEYSLEDIYLAMRILLMAGFSLLPIASLLPIKGLIQLINLGLAKDVSGRFLEVLVVALDQRMKLALTGDANYQLGDKTKEQLRLSLARFTGNNVYQFGDLTKAVQTRDFSTETRVHREDDLLTLRDSVADDLEEWDRRFFQTLQVGRESDGGTSTMRDGTSSDSEYIKELAEWDRKFYGASDKN